uniref:Progonadoliberin n=1 Tax=Hippocampus comes TaxID=109280 RepID=A0A3Q3DF85_HIPCM
APPPGLAPEVGPVICQHWSYGLNPGGKRELHPFNQQTNVVGGFQHLGKPCRVLACGDLSPFAKLCRMKEFHVRHLKWQTKKYQ